ncbi:hypothetical protein DKX38_001162 [Salix brachista]|uniref:Uncharacterized protein n=1 Tax=Salix brachista TaxID=2182728 RepID=A0A5N5P428_9ROSI|nr:hypothetical protein DKX38_001162 [Salix brachista]
MPSFLAGSYVPYRWLEYIGESAGHLHLVPGSRTSTSQEADVQEMRGDYSGWLVKYQVDLHVFDFLVKYLHVVVRRLFSGSLNFLPIPNLRLLVMNKSSPVNFISNSEYTDDSKLL